MGAAAPAGAEGPSTNPDGVTTAGELSAGMAGASSTGGLAVPTTPGADASSAEAGNETDGSVEEQPGIVAATPPMGWNSWNTFQCNMDETLIENVADIMQSSGMQAAGYEYVSLDDCWMAGRDDAGNLLWNTTKFPSGIPALAEYVHGKGLKFGIYQSANTTTCVGLYGGINRAVAVGSLGREAQDAQTFASWGVDLLKYDLCAGDRNSLVVMGNALRATGRPIVYSINPGNGPGDLRRPDAPGWDPIAVANMWRIEFDINASWTSVLSIIDTDGAFARFAGPGHWNDADMLEVGKGMSVDEDRAHFSMWAILASPLLAGNDIRSMTPVTREILTNTDVIQVNQDALGRQGVLVASPQPNIQIWSKELAAPNTRAVALLNRSAGPASITVQWDALGLPAGAATVRDLWSHTDLGSIDQAYTAQAVPSHGVVMLRVSSAP